MLLHLSRCKGCDKANLRFFPLRTFTIFFSLRNKTTASLFIRNIEVMRNKCCIDTQSYFLGTTYSITEKLCSFERSLTVQLAEDFFRFFCYNSNILFPSYTIFNPPAVLVHRAPENGRIIHVRQNQPPAQSRVSCQVRPVCSQLSSVSF